MLLRPCVLPYIFNFPGSRGSSGDHWNLLRPCILQYVINFTASQRSSRRTLDAAQTLYFTIYDQLSQVSGELQQTTRCCSGRAFYN